MNDEYLWSEKWRPIKVQDVILPESIKASFQKFVDTKNIPNLILCGSAGVGKTTLAKALVKEIGSDYLVLNGSDEGRKIDTLRTTIKNFASTISFSEGRKYVIFDEFDYANAESVMPAMRNFMEEFSSNCGFIFTCNFVNRIIEPLRSRCSVIDFKTSKEDKQKLAVQFFKRVCHILTTEEIPFEKKVVAEVINKYFPDNRKVLNELQRYSSTGKIDNGILSVHSDVSFEGLFKNMKEKDYTSVRKWVSQNMDSDSSFIFKKLYELLISQVTASTIPRVVVCLAEYQYKSAFVADQEINLAACLAELMIDVEWK